LDGESNFIFINSTLLIQCFN